MDLAELNEGREHRIEIELPYALAWDDLHLEARKPVIGEKDGDEDHPMAWFVDDVSWADHEQITRVWITTIALQVKYPDASFYQCLETAIIYERG